MEAAGGVWASEWADRRRAEVMALAGRFVERHSLAPEQRALLQTALLDARANRQPTGTFVPSVHLPLLVYAALGGEEEDALPLALAMTLLELGIDLLDHIADREVAQSHWQGRSPVVVQLAAVGFLCALPQLALSTIDAPPERIAGLHRTLAEHFVRIGLGQQLDLELARSPRPRLDEVDAAVRGKTGDRRALYARLAAQLAHASEELCEAYAAIAREYGIARQLTSDAMDLAAGQRSRDLANGARTWPVTWLLNRLDDEPRQQFLELLDRARSDEAARWDAWRTLFDRGALTRTLIEVNLHRDAALRALDRAGPKEPAASVLRAMISEVGWGKADASSVA